MKQGVIAASVIALLSGSAMAGNDTIYGNIKLTEHVINLYANDEIKLEVKDISGSMVCGINTQNATWTDDTEQRFLTVPYTCSSGTSDSYITVTVSPGEKYSLRTMDANDLIRVTMTKNSVGRDIGSNFIKTGSSYTSNGDSYVWARYTCETTPVVPAANGKGLPTGGDALGICGSRMAETCSKINHQNVCTPRESETDINADFTVSMRTGSFKGPRHTATELGTSSSQTLSLDVLPGGMDIGQPGIVFVSAVTPFGSFQLDSNGSWVRLTSRQVAVPNLNGGTNMVSKPDRTLFLSYPNGIPGTISITPYANLDVGSILSAGYTSICVGYGRGLGVTEASDYLQAYNLNTCHTVTAGSR